MQTTGSSERAASCCGTFALSQEYIAKRNAEGQSSVRARRIHVNVLVVCRSSLQRVISRRARPIQRRMVERLECAVVVVGGDGHH